MGHSDMADRWDELTQTLLEQIDARLREAEEVRNYVKENWRKRPFYPEHLSKDQETSIPNESSSESRDA